MLSKRLIIFVVAFAACFWQFSTLASTYNPKAVEILLDQPASPQSIERAMIGSLIPAHVQYSDTPDGITYYTGDLTSFRSFNLIEGSIPQHENEVLVNREYAEKRLKPRAVRDQTTFIRGKEYRISGVFEGREGVFIPVQDHTKLTGRYDRRLQMLFRNKRQSARQNISQVKSIFRLNGVQVLQWYDRGQLASLSMRLIVLLYSAYVGALVYRWLDLEWIKSFRRYWKQRLLYIIAHATVLVVIWYLLAQCAFLGDTQLTWVEISEYGKWMWQLGKWKFYNGFTMFDGALLLRSSQAAVLFGSTVAALYGIGAIKTSGEAETPAEGEEETYDSETVLVFTQENEKAS